MDRSFNSYVPTDGQEQTVVGTLSYLHTEKALMVLSSVGCPCLPLIALITTIRPKRYMMFAGRLSALQPINLQTSTLILFIPHLHLLNHNCLLIRSLTHGTVRLMVAGPGTWKIPGQLVSWAPGVTLEALVVKYPSMKLSNLTTKDEHGCQILHHFSPPPGQLLPGPYQVMILKLDRASMLQ